MLTSLDLLYVLAFHSHQRYHDDTGLPYLIPDNLPLQPNQIKSSSHPPTHPLSDAGAPLNTRHWRLATMCRHPRAGHQGKESGSSEAAIEALSIKTTLLRRQRSESRTVYEGLHAHSLHSLEQNPIELRYKNPFH